MQTFTGQTEKRSDQDKLKILMIAGNHQDIILTDYAVKRIDVSYVLDVVDSLEEASQYLNNCISKKNKKLPDILIIDLEFAPKEKTEFLQMLEENPDFSETEIVILIDPKVAFDRAAFSELLSINYIKKPVNKQKILELLEGISFEKSGEHLYFPSRRKVTDTQDNLERTFQPSDHEIDKKYKKLSRILDELDCKKIENKDSGAIRVLLIEDNLADVRLIEEKLNRAFPNEFEIISKSSLKDGLVCLTQMNIDVITVDFVLPDVSGLEVISQIRKIAADIPIIVLTGVNDASLALETLKMGAQDYLVKDVDRYGEILGRILKYGIERKKVERLIQHSLKVEQNILNDVLNEAPFFVIRVDSSLNIKAVNPAFEKTCSMTQKELRGKPIKGIIPCVNMDQMKAVIDDGANYSMQQKRVESIGKNVFDNLYLDFVVWPIQRMVSGKKEAIILCTDVSQSVNLIKQREEFVAALAHDIRNPLIGELRVLEAIARETLGKLDKPIIAAINSIIKSNNSLLLMLSNMMEVYKLEASGTTLHLENLDFGELTCQVVSEMGYLTYGGERKIDFSKLDDHCRISGDKTALTRVIQNLIYNAVKYSPSDSEILVTVSNDQESNVILRVKNTGSAISENEKSSLFNRFERGKQGRRSSHSSGFGLYLCKQIVDGHGGIIGCSSSDEETVFIVSIPGTN